MKKISKQQNLNGKLRAGTESVASAKAKPARRRLAKDVQATKRADDGKDKLS